MGVRSSPCPKFHFGFLNDGNIGFKNIRGFSARESIRPSKLKDQAIECWKVNGLTLKKRQRMQVFLDRCHHEDPFCTKVSQIASARAGGESQAAKAGSRSIMCTKVSAITGSNCLPAPSLISCMAAAGFRIDR